MNSNTPRTLAPLTKPVTVYNSAGVPTPVAVRQLRIKDFPRLLAAIDDEPVAAEIYCGKTSGWAETITDESIVEVCKAGEELNESFFVPWARRRMERQAKLVGAAIEGLRPGGSRTTAPSLPQDASSAS